MQEPEEHSFFFGYALHVRGLTESDVDNYGLDLGDHEIVDCVAIDGEDMARVMTAVVDTRRRELVWSSIPAADYQDSGSEYVVPDPTAFADAAILLVEQLFPWVRIPRLEAPCCGEGLAPIRRASGA